MFDLFPIDWAGFHFMRPELLWLLVPLFVILVMGAISLRQEIKWKYIISPHLRPYVIQQGSESKKLLMYGLLLFGMVSGIVGAAGPTWEKIEVPGQQLETPAVLILDMSDSMLSDDIPPNRLERAKFKINDFLSQDPRARVALIGYAGTAHTIVPLTHDYEIIRSHVDGLSPSVMPESGNSFSEALQLADSVMAVTTAPGIVMILSDDTEEVWEEEIRQYQQFGDHRIMLLSFNSQMASTSSTSDITRFDRYQLTLDKSDVELMAESIRQDLVFTESPEEKEDEWRDTGWILTLPTAVVLLMWFRRGWVLICLLMVFTSCNWGERFQDLWYSKDYQGQMLSDQGKFEQAAATYIDPLRQGVAYYKAGKFQEAARAFDKDTTAIAAYNKGLAFAQMGDLSSAQLAFQQAVEMDPNFEQALESQEKISQIIQQQDEVNFQDAEEQSAGDEQAENIQNKDMEDLGGGGQEATEEDMQKERKEETVTTDIRKGKELDEVPDDIGSTQQDNSKVLMQKVDDDPSLFLKRKFEYQLKKRRAVGNE